MKTIFIVLMMAGSAFAADKPNVPMRVAQLEDEVTILKRRVEDLEKQVAELKASIESLRGTDSPEFKNAILQHKLLVGMTKEQADRAMKGFFPQVTSQAVGAETIDWFEAHGQDGSLVLRAYSARFENGKIVFLIPGHQ